MTLVTDRSAATAAHAARRYAVLLAVVVTAMYTAVLSVAGSAAAAPGAAQPKSPAEAHYTPAPCKSAEQNYDNRDFARCFAMVRTALDHLIKADPNDPPPTALGPADIQNAYSLPATGQGRTVGIVDAFGDSHAEADLAQFRSFYGLPPCTSANGCFQKTDQNGGTDYPTDDPGWALETSLDLDAVSAACPACKILLVEGDDNGLDNLGIAVDTAVSLGAKYVSNSYGVPGEFVDETSLDHYYDHQGVAVTASTGDIGDLTNWPATNPHVVAVGGTTLNRDTGTSRGWTESAWADGGSGCSPFEPRPDYQNGITTDCANRAIADVSADADPETGLAVFDTLGQDGWLQVGGTSLSSPLVAAMYALAGTPVAGTYPVTYPYERRTDLHDVTQGNNGSCSDVLCNAGPGWDGPTGLGTPDGVRALTTPPHGQIAGTVTDAQTHAPLAGATVATQNGHSATTDAAGRYNLSVPVGTYDVTARAFGYVSVAHQGVAVTKDHTTRADFALSPIRSRTLSGVITDGSGHHWPLYAKITIDGFPGGAIYSNPYTGHYSVRLPQNHTYTLHVTPQLPGYRSPALRVPIGTADVTRDIAVPVDASSCDAAGYTLHFNGTVEQFTGWTGTTPQDGWRNVDYAGNGQVWSFDNPGDRTPPPGSDGDFAIIDSDHYGQGNTQNTSLISPTTDLSGEASPEVGFDTEYRAINLQTADVDVSINGGATWTNVWHQDTDSVSGHVDIPLPMAAHQANVKVRFHFTGTWGWWWSLDNVFIGTRSCVPTPGGLLAGVVIDANTHAGLVGAKVSSVARPSEFGVTRATPDDPNVPDGFYEFFSSLTGPRRFIVTDGRYEPAAATVNVLPDRVTQRYWVLRAGRLTVSPTSISTVTTLGMSRTTTLTFGNSGTEPVQVTLGEQNGGFTPMSQPGDTSGAPLQRIKGTFSPAAAVTQAGRGGTPRAGVQLRTATPSAAPWQDIADYPTPTMDNAVGYNDGKVYSVAGYDGSANVANGYVYDAGSTSWTAIADAPAALESPTGAFLNGKFYLVGGWDDSGDASTGVYAYDPTSDSWSQQASLPQAVSAAAAAVLGGQLYIIGGCTTGACAPTSQAVFRYDDGSNSWTQLADYPTPEAFLGCAGITGEVVCTGGVNADTDATSKATYLYDPGSDTWTQGADMPYDDWAMDYAGANNQLEVAAGVTDDSTTVTNQAATYDPSTNAWAALPNANDAEYRGGGSCGFYKIGGSTGGFSPTPFSEVLPGYGQCGGGADVPWLSEAPTQFTVAPGQHVSVTVTTDSSVVPQPGTYTAKISVGTDSPYPVTPVTVSMTVNPPSTWGKVAGTVTDASTGNPIPGATVQVCTMYDPTTGMCGQVTYTLKTDSNGYYQLWLNHGYNPLQIIAAKDGYQPQARTVRISQGTTTTVNFALRKA